MGFGDTLKDLTKKAQDAAAEHQDQIRAAVQKAQVTVNQQTGGKYEEKIAKAGAKAEALVESLKPSDPPSGAEPTGSPEP